VCFATLAIFSRAARATPGHFPSESKSVERSEGSYATENSAVVNSCGSCIPVLRRPHHHSYGSHRRRTIPYRVCDFGRDQRLFHRHWYYNTFATTEANLNPELAALGTTWTAIASTGAYPGGATLVNAIDNIGMSGGAVYNTDGQLVASNDGTGAGGLWDGDGISNPIEYDENGNTLSASVWTGTSPDGDAFPYYYAIALGSGGDSVYGASSDTIDWVDACGSLSCGAAYADNGNAFSLYAISGELTYESAPEPGTVRLMILGAMLLVGKLRNMRAKAAGSTSVE